MSALKAKLITNLEKRMYSEITSKSPLKYLIDTADGDIPPEEFAETLIRECILCLHQFSRRKGAGASVCFFAEVICAVGNSFMKTLGMRRDSSVAAKTGAFALYTFESARLIEVSLGQGKRGHAAYIVTIKEDNKLNSLFNEIPFDKTLKLPATSPYSPFETCFHETGARLIKTKDQKALSITAKSHPIVFESVNKSMKTGWRINRDVLLIYKWALKNHTDAFAEIWEMQSPAAKASKMRETKTIGDMAERLLDMTFYHMYYLDFRGRKYPATAYLHEQGSDLAKGLLLRHDKKAIGEDGFNWLLISLANNWAGGCGRADGAKTDKIPLKDRVEWALANEATLIGYAMKPKVNTGWMKADKPWQFIANCIELSNIRLQQKIDRAPNPYHVCSHIECYIDGSNNGSQHLSALTRDEITAPLVNLVPQDMPGDLYKHIADFVWKEIEAQVSNLTEEEYSDCVAFIEELDVVKRVINESPHASELHKEKIYELIAIKQSNEALVTLCGLVFWDRIKDAKHRRKVVKRNVMTLPYGGTAYGLGQQQCDDARKHGIEALNTMEKAWGAYMGRLVFENCQLALKRPMQLLSVFENAGKRVDQKLGFLSWDVPKTGFKVVQHYTEGQVKKVYVQYGPPVGPRLSTGYYENTLQVNVCFTELQVPSKHKQAQGAAPNAIHSLDAAHLMLTSHNCDFTVTTIHDSYGCLLADMSKLYVKVRESFVELYEENPLYSLMGQIGGDLSGVTIGDLDIHAILESEYAFA